MANKTATPAAIPATTEQATLGDLYLDAHDERREVDAADETRWQAEARGRVEQRAAKLRGKLAGKHGVAVYRELARRSPGLTDAEYRYLDTLLSAFGSTFKNCFASRKTVQGRMGGPPRSLTWWDQVRGRLEGKWIRRIPLTRDEDQELVEANSAGRFVSAVGVQFLIPPGVIAPLDPGWKGPRVWNKRLVAQRPTASGRL
jgi:hypothetical protein